MSATAPAKALKLNQLTQTLLEALDDRSRDIISRRFGLNNGHVETLESIGKEYGITRERVRQIESQAKKVLAALHDPLQPVAEVFEEIFVNHGGILADNHVVAVVREVLGQDNIHPAVVTFYLEILPPYTYVSRDQYFAPHWRYPAVVTDKAVVVVESARQILKQTQHPLPEQELIEGILHSLKETLETLPSRYIDACLKASKHVNQTPFLEWGLAGWPETNPRGVGDKAYAVLRRHGKPEHFTRITNLINEAAFDHKQANAQTVHNELIKDDRFVLVGRGLYGLAEWGYIPGTVADVLESLLARAQTPLTREELIEQVLAQRQVKKNTILLGLQNEKRFIKTPENRYTLRS
ncbi:MAG: HTH domain-containing protein [Candidatus Andersenbacteria bacterium]